MLLCRHFETSFIKSAPSSRLITRVYDEEIDWFVWENGEYVALQSDKKGVIESRFFAGLCLNVKAILVGELAQVLRDLQKGLATKKHKEFVNQLKAKK
jgi:hypothetical protein